jgi:hypothetical protein
MKDNFDFKENGHFISSTQSLFIPSGEAPKKGKKATSLEFILL